MGNIGGTELLVIFVLALLLLGPKKLPEIGDALGRTLRRFRQASRELRDELDVRSDLDIRGDIEADDERTTPRVQRAREARAREAPGRGTSLPSEPTAPTAPAAAARDPAASEPEGDPDRPTH